MRRPRGHREKLREDEESRKTHGKGEEERRKERRSETEAAGAVGYLLAIQPLTMPL